MRKTWILRCCLAAVALLVRSAMAQEQEKAEKSSGTGAAAAAATASSPDMHSSALPKPGREVVAEERAARLEGEKRFRTNCGRCHQQPHKFPPRVMATAIRHMRVRAMITDEDMRFILRYMTQ